MSNRQSSPWRGIGREDDGLNFVTGARDPLVMREWPDDQADMVREGETLLEVANRAYGEPLLYWILADRNKIDDPLRVEAGTAIVVPSRIRAMTMLEYQRRRRAP